MELKGGKPADLICDLPAPNPIHGIERDGEVEDLGSDRILENPIHGIESSSVMCALARALVESNTWN